MKHSPWKLGIVTVAALALVGCAGGGTPAADDGGGSTDPYTLGVALALTGPTASNVVVYREAAEVAVEEINAAGGIDGVPLELAVEDTQGTADGGVTAMNKLINLGDVDFALVSASGPALAAQPAAAQAETVILCVGSVSPALLNLPYLYLNAVNLTRLVPSLADEMWDQGFRDIGFMGGADPFGEGAFSVLKPYWEELGGTIVSEQYYDSATGGDYSSQLLQIKSANPDFVFAVGVGEVLGNIVKQTRSAGIDVPMGGPLATGGLLHAAGTDADGFQDVSMALDPELDSEAAVAFRDGFTAVSEQAPAWDSGSGYEAVYLYKSLVEQAIEEGKDPRSGAVLNELIASATFEDILQGGEVTFLPDHSVSRLIALRKVENGEFVTEELIEPTE